MCSPISRTVLSLPQKPTEEILKTLLRAKLMLLHSHEHASQPTEFDNMIAILSLDNSVEYLLRCVASSLDLESLTGKNFEIAELAELAKQINKSLNELASTKLTHIGDIRSLRKVRNLVQHGSIAPQADLERFVTIVERFFM